MIVSVLTKEQIATIHQASLTVLHRTGVVIPHKQVLDMFADHGADVNHEKEWVRIPPDLVEYLLGKAKKQYTLYGRDMEKTAPFGLGKRNYQSSSGQALWLDSVGQKRRYSSLKDVSVAARFADALDCITIVGPMADPHEIPVNYRCVAVLAEMLKNTTKPLAPWFHDRASAKYIVELLIALRGDKDKAANFPVCYPFLEPISPLRFPANGIDLLFETSRIDLPVSVGPMAQMGLSGPATIAGTMVQENAEILAGICVTQLIKPGLPVCYGGICHAFDMATTQVVFSGPEQAIFGAAMTQMGKYYGLPVYVNVGLTDSKCADAQAGLEVGVTFTTGAAAGADMLGHMGICGADQAASLDVLVMQSEIIDYIESMMREIEFTDDTLAIDLIDSIGPGGTFIDTVHTAEHFRNELWFPQLLDRKFYQAWMEAGATTMQQRCAEHKDNILRNHEPEPIPKDLEQTLDEIVRAAKKDLG